MPKFFIETNQINEDLIYLQGEDVNHIANVLRKKTGENINICNNDTSENFLCRIENIEKEKIICKILEKLEAKSEANIQITIFQGLPKADKLELIIQKCVELGVKEITPINMERCIVKLDNKSEIKKIERWQKIAEVAAKQSGRDSITEINAVENLKSVCNLIQKYDIVLVAYEQEKINTLKSELNKIKNIKNLKIAIVIGPEGGFEHSEIDILRENGAKVITLGERILRTETVGIVMASIIMYELE